MSHRRVYLCGLAHVDCSALVDDAGESGVKRWPVWRAGWWKAVGATATGGCRSSCRSSCVCYGKRERVQLVW